MMPLHGGGHPQTVARGAIPDGCVPSSHACEKSLKNFRPVPRAFAVRLPLTSTAQLVWLARHRGVTALSISERQTLA